MSGIRIFAIVLISVLTFLIIAFYAITFLFYKLSLARKSYAKTVVIKKFEEKPEDYAIDRSFWDKNIATELTLKNQDGIALKGYFLKNKNKTNKLAVIVHGYYSSHKDMSIQAKIFQDLGFDVFCPDLFGHGASEGKFVQMGLNDARDVSDWCKYFVQNNPKVEIAVFGWSMGGATSAIMAGMYDMKNIKAYIVECPYNNAYEEFGEIMKYRNLKPKFLLPFANLSAKMYCSYSLKDANPEKIIALSQKPVLVLHGNSDHFVPFYMGKKVFEAKKSGDKRFVEFENAGHCKCYKTDKEKYLKTINEWISAYFD